jgi:hypothetical protein
MRFGLSGSAGSVTRGQQPVCTSDCTDSWIFIDASSTGSYIDFSFLRVVRTASFPSVRRKVPLFTAPWVV